MAELDTERGRGHRRLRRAESEAARNEQFGSSEPIEPVERSEHKASKPTVPPELRRRCLWIVGVATVLAYATDLATKIWAVEELSNREPIEVVGTLFQLELIRNPGAAFGLGVGITIVFTVVSLGVVGALLYYARRLGSTGWALVFGLVLGGALGNLTDRLLRDPGVGRGHVVDMFHLKNWPVFNVADSAFCVAGGIVVLLALRNIPLEGRRPGDDGGTVEATADEEDDMWSRPRRSPVAED